MPVNPTKEALLACFKDYMDVDEEKTVDSYDNSCFMEPFEDTFRDVDERVSVLDSFESYLNGNAEQYLHSFYYSPVGSIINSSGLGKSKLIC